MTAIEKQYYIDKIDDIIKTENLSKDNLERIIIIKEGIKKADSKSGLLKILGTFWDLFK